MTDQHVLEIVLFICGCLTGGYLAILLLPTPADLNAVRFHGDCAKRQLAEAQSFINSQMQYIHQSDRRFERMVRWSTRITRRYNGVVNELSRQGAEVFVDKRTGDVIIKNRVAGPPSPFVN